MNTTLIKQKNEIGRTIERYLPLKWRGSRGTGLCPFHDDKHPSLTVDTRKQRFICYACGAKGDVIEFIKRIEGCDFKEALEKLEGGRLRPMVTSPERLLSRPAPAPITIPDHNRFLKLLMPYVPPCRELISVYHRFEVGLSPHRVPDGWQGQSNRIVFPLRDENGVLRGFSARSRQEGAKTAKYIHTGSSQGFRSSEHLYGLYVAKKRILETGMVYVTEGFKDALAMQGAGFTGSVALMGTALSERQVELLKRYCRKAVIVLDGDKPGRRAAEKVAERLSRAGFLTQVILLPQGEDPNSMVRIEGTEEFRNFIEEQVAVYHPLERELVAATLLYPEVVYEGRRWVCLVCETLFREEIGPELSFHGELLRGLERGEIPEELEDMAEGYRQEERERIKEWLERDNRGMEYGLFRLLVIYMEERLEREVGWLSCRLRHEGEQQKRERILERLTARKELGAAVARWLERMGATPVEFSLFPKN